MGVGNIEAEFQVIRSEAKELTVDATAHCEADVGVSRFERRAQGFVAVNGDKVICILLKRAHDLESVRPDGGDSHDVGNQTAR